jgi:hypothetical protein
VCEKRDAGAFSCWRTKVPTELLADNHTARPHLAVVDQPQAAVKQVELRGAGGLGAAAGEAAVGRMSQLAGSSMQAQVEWAFPSESVRVWECTQPSPHLVGAGHVLGGVVQVGEGVAWWEDGGEEMMRRLSVLDDEMGGQAQ